MCYLSYPQLLSCAYSYKYLEVLWLPKRTQLWACFNTEPNRLYRRLRLFPSKLQEYTPPPFSRLSTQYHIDPLLACLLSLDTSRTGLRLQRSTKFSNRHTAHGRYEYSYNLANSRENWAQKKNRAAGAVVRRRAINLRAYASVSYCAARMPNQLRRGHRAWPMFELKSGAAMAAPAAPMPPPLNYSTLKVSSWCGCSGYLIVSTSGD